MSCYLERSTCRFEASTLIVRFLGPTRGPSGADRTQVGPMLALWTLPSGYLLPGALNLFSGALNCNPLLINWSAPFINWSTPDNHWSSLINNWSAPLFIWSTLLINRSAPLIIWDAQQNNQSPPLNNWSAQLINAGTQGQVRLGLQLGKYTFRRCQ